VRPRLPPLRLLAALFVVASVCSVAIPASADPPAALDHGYSVGEDSVLSVEAPGVLDGATDGEGNPLTAAVDTSPGHASAFSLAPDGSFTYTPDADFHGEDSFTFHAVADGDAEPDGGVATATITVDPVNDAPAASDDVAGTSQDVPLTVAAPGVLANDTDADLDALQAVLDDPPLHGALDLQPDGSYTYTPDAGFHGTDTFTYHAVDPDLAASGTATVTITVTNIGPVAAPDAYPADGDPPLEEDTTLDVAAPGLLGNDSDAEGDAVTAVFDSPPAHGELTLYHDGSFAYTPDPDFAGADSFTYRASDGLTESAPATVAITVSPVEDPPVAVDDEATTPEDTAAVIPVLANDTDPDSGDTLSVDLQASAASDGSVSDNGDGTVTYAPSQDFHGTDGFEYTADDGNGGTATAHVTVHVTSVNDPPVGAADAYTALSAPLSESATSGVLGNDGDADGDGLHATMVTGPTLGTLALHDDGSFIYTPLAGVCRRDDGFTYRVSDGTAQSAPIVVTLAVRLPLRAAALTLSRSATAVSYRGPVTVTAHLSAFSPGARMTITRKPFGSSPIPLVTHAPDAKGNLRFTVPSLVKRNSFVATSRFDNCHPARTSAAAVVQVRAKVTGALSGSYRTTNGVRLFHHGRDPFFRAAVLPAHPAANVRWIWQRRVGNAWRDYFTPTVGTAGSATGFFLTGTALGQTYRIRALGPYDPDGTAVADNLPGASGWIVFRVTS
jgi:VCBS repeat-containing protein